MDTFLNDYIKFIFIILIFLIMILSFIALLINDNDGLHVILVIIIYAFIVICCKLNYGNCTHNLPILDYYTSDSESNLNNLNPLIALKVNNIYELDPNYSKECCICLENIDLLESFKLSNCKYHLFHEQCIQKYIDNNFTKCPTCNTP